MTTLRAAASCGGARRRAEQSQLRLLYENTIKGGFLLPYNFHCCVHEWHSLDSGYSVCRECGSEHWCCCGECPEVVSENSERVCTITGCVTLEYEMRPERTVLERIGPSSQTATTAKKKGQRALFTHNKKKNAQRQQYQQQQSVHELLCRGCWHGEHLRDIVEATVREILDSSCTEKCIEQERKRNEAKELAIFSRALREAAHDRRCLRPNMLFILAQVAHHCRKNRNVTLRQNVDMEVVISQCTDSIAGLLLIYGGQRVARQMQNTVRYREFICSMLYLMRVGVTFQQRQILPRMDLLNVLLPLQVLLPLVFKIRAKSITEGENMVNMEPYQCGGSVVVAVVAV